METKNKESLQIEIEALEKALEQEKENGFAWYTKCSKAEAEIRALKMIIKELTPFI
jgi:hypothetical protein